MTQPTNLPADAHMNPYIDHRATDDQAQVARNGHYYATARRLVVNPDTLNGRTAVLTALHIEALAINVELTELRAAFKTMGPAPEPWAMGVSCGHGTIKRDCEWCNPQSGTALAQDEAVAPQLHPIVMTDVEATEEALRLFVRKMRRLRPSAFRYVTEHMTDDALTALYAGEARADARFMDDVRRTWPESSVWDAGDTPLTDRELGHWFAVHGTPVDQIPALIEEHRGANEADMDALNAAAHGQTA